MARLPVDIITAGNRNELPNGQFVVEKASADAFGGQVGKALEGLGDAGMALAVKINANQKQLQQFGYEDQFIKLQEQDNTEYEQRHRGISGTADGWWQGARTSTKSRFDEWLKTLPEQARAEYQVKADRFIAGRSSQAFKDQFNQQDTHTKQTLTEEQRKAGLQVQQNPLTYDQFVKQQSDLIDKSTLPAAEKERLKIEARNSLAYTAEISKAQNDPAATLAGRVGGGFRETLRAKESGGNDSAAAGSSSAVGRYQFLAGTWNAFAAKAGVPPVTGDGEDPRLNPTYQEKVLDQYIAASTAKLSAEKLPVTDANLYMLHFLGQEGGARFLREMQKDSSASAATLFPKEAAANRSIFFARNEARNLADVYNVLTRKFNGGGTTPAASRSAGALTPQQSAAVGETALRQFTAQEQQRIAQLEADNAARRNQLYIDLKEGVSPEASYRAARQSGLLSDFADIEKAERIIKERNRGEEEYNRGLALMQGGRNVANAYDKEHRDGVQAFYDRTVKGGADPAATAAAVFDRTGIVPAAFAKAVRGAIISEDPTRVAAGLATAANMMRQSPNAFAGVEGGDELGKNANEYRRLTEQLGMSSDQAAQRIMADARDTTKLDPVRQEQLQQFRKQSLTQEQIDARLRSNFSSWNPFSDAPFSVQLPTGPQRTAMASIYSEFATEGLEKFRDPDKALAFADMRVQQQFGVQNGVLMRYPPSKAGLPRLAGTPGGGFGWINEQAAGVVKDRLGAVVDPAQVVLVPVERDGASTRAAFNGQPMTVTRDDSGRAEQRTTFQSVPYMIMVMPKTPDQDVLVVNGVFFPDVDTYVAEKNKKIEADNLSAPPLTGYDMFGVPFEVPAYQKPLIDTPEQKQRADRARKEQELRDAQAAERAYTAGETPAGAARAEELAAMRKRMEQQRSRLK